MSTIEVPARSAAFGGPVMYAKTAHELLPTNLVERRAIP